jgi:hypothetical protein
MNSVCCFLDDLFGQRCDARGGFLDILTRAFAPNALNHREMFILCLFLFHMCTKLFNLSYRSSRAGDLNPGSEY